MREWVGRFESKPGSMCPGFRRLRYIAACPHTCPYCYLQGVYWRGRPRDIVEADLSEMERAVARWMERTIEPAMLNAGELSDSFAPEISAQASLRLIELFRCQSRHTLLLLSKAMPAVLLDVEPTPKVIMSFSLGQPRLRTEDGEWVELSPQFRPDYLRSVVERSWRVRLRVDPLIDHLGVARIAAAVSATRTRFERITLGTLRFTSAGYRAVANGSPTQRALAARVRREEGEAGTHPYRLPLVQRVGLYAAMIASLRETDTTDLVALCKETPEAWQRTFGVVPEVIPCNCTL